MANKSFRVDKFSHNFAVTQYNNITEQVIKNFAVSNFMDYKSVRQGYRYISVPHKMYASRCRPEQEYRFHINVLDDFILHCANNAITKDDIDFHEHIAERGLDVDLRLETTKTPRGEQPDILAYLAALEPTVSKLVRIQPGGGKTFCAMSAICAEGRRMVAVLKGKYIDKWVSDIVELANCTKDDILVVKGSAALMAAIAAGTDGTLTAKAIIISNRTLQNWFCLYEEIGDKILERGYDCTPADLFKALKADVRLIDEVHEDFHFNFLLDTYTHVHKSISLSATPLSDTPLVQQMIDTAYPVHWRYNQKNVIKFINSYAYLYKVHRPDRIRTQADGKYNHHMVEASFRKDPAILRDFFRSITDILNERFITNFLPGTRALIFCSGIEMCTELVMYLQMAYPGADIRRYVEDDPYENITDARICVSTIQSAGTGIDIIGLKLVIMTVAMNSTKSNIQGAGRLRYVEGMDLEFYYYVCEDIPKHVEYHEQKTRIMNDFALTHTVIDSKRVLGSP